MDDLEIAEIECRYENHIDDIMKAHASELTAKDARVRELEAELRMTIGDNSVLRSELSDARARNIYNRQMVREATSELSTARAENDALREKLAVAREALEQLIRDYGDVPDATDSDGQSVFTTARAALDQITGGAPQPDTDSTSPSGSSTG